MAINLSQARKFCNATEFNLVEWTRPAALARIPPYRLRQKIQRARKLRDKYRDLARRQRLEVRGKKAPRSSRRATGEEVSRFKAELFTQVLAVFADHHAHKDSTTRGAAAPRSSAPRRKAAAKSRFKAGTGRKGRRKKRR